MTEPRAVAVWFSAEELKLMVHMLSGCVMQLLRDAPGVNVKHDPRADMLCLCAMRMDLQRRWLEEQQHEQPPPGGVQ